MVPVAVLLIGLASICPARAIMDPWYKDVYWLWDSNKETAFKAISRNDYPTFYRMIRKGVDVNAVNARGHSLLCCAIAEERWEMFLLLLKNGADTKKYKYDPKFDNDSELYWAAFRGRLDMCSMLLKSGADSNMACRGKTALIAAVERGDYAMTEMLLKAGADPNYGSGWGPALHVASRGYGTEIIKLLLKYGAKVNTLHEGRSALAEAVDRDRDFQFNSITKAEILLAAGADVNLYKESFFRNNFPLHLAVLSGNTELAAMLIAHGANVNEKIVIPSALSAHLQPPKKRFDMASGQAVKKKQKETVSSPLSAAIKTGYRPMVELLLKHGAKTTAKQLDEIKKIKVPGKPETLDLFKILYGQYACKHSRYELVKRIIATGANANTLNESHQSLLEKVASGRGSIDLLKLLLQHDAKYKSYALKDAVDSGSIDKVNLLLKHGAEPNIVSKLALSAPTAVFYLNKNATIILPLLLKAGADLNQKNYRRQNLLAVNCYAHRDTLVYKSLIKAGADWRNLDKYGQSIAESIISADYTGRCTGEIKVLLDQGTDRKKIRELAKKYDRENLLFLLNHIWEKK